VYTVISSLFFLFNLMSRCQHTANVQVYHRLAEDTTGTKYQYIPIISKNCVDILKSVQMRQFSFSFARGLKHKSVNIPSESWRCYYVGVESK
jgi:hypothetical protein